MYNLNSRADIGDIILVKGSAKHSKFITKATKGPFSHACLMVGKTQIIESLTSSGVQYTSSQKFIVDNLENIIVLRPKFKNKTIADVTRLAIAEIAREYQSRGYNFVDALKSVLGTKTCISTEKYFCSQLVAHIFHQVNYPIIEKLIHNVTPNSFLNSPLLKDITSEVFELIPNHIRDRLTARNILLKCIDVDGKTNSLTAILFRNFIKQSKYIFLEYKLTPPVRMFDIIDKLTDPSNSDIYIELDCKITDLYDSLNIIEQLRNETATDYDDSEQFKEEIRSYDFEIVKYELLATNYSIINLNKQLHEARYHETLFDNCYNSLNITYAKRLSEYYNFIVGEIEWVLSIFEKDEKYIIEHLASLDRISTNYFT